MSFHAVIVDKLEAEFFAPEQSLLLQKFVSEVIHLMFWPSLLTALALAFFGPYVLSLFGADFKIGYPTMLVVLIGLVLRTATGPVEYLLTMTGHHRDTMWVYAFAALASIGLGATIEFMTSNFCARSVFFPFLAESRMASRSRWAPIGASRLGYSS